MARPGIVVLAVLLAVTVVFLVAKGTGSADRAEGHGDSGKGGPAAETGGGKSNRAPKSGAPAIPAAKLLRGVLTAELADAPEFEEVDEMARRLSDAELQELIAEVGLASEKGLEGWVRAALFAEWGRRDADAALAYLDNPPLVEPGKWALEQAWFSVFRGWANVDPAAAVARLDKENVVVEIPYPPRRGSSPYWMYYAYTELYTQFARHDADAAWKALATTGERVHAIEGFFRGLESERQVREFVERWVSDWSSEEARKAHDLYVTQLNSSFTGVIMVPPDEVIAGDAAAALARFDLQAAEEWVRTTGPGDDKIRVNRRADLLRGWASEFPDQARELIGEEGYHQETLGRGIIQADPARAVELMESMDNHGVRARTLMTSFGGMGSHHVQDYYPAPGGRNRLPNFEERYQVLLEAVEAGNFQEGQERSLLRSLNRTFLSQVPAAKEASESAR